MRARHPEAFERFIKAQTHMIATNYTVILNHIGPDAMYYLSEKILAVPGVKLILPCHTVNEDGRYKILVHQKDYHRVREYLKEVLTHWYDTYVEPDAKVPDTRYPGKPEVSPIQSDGFSQGDNTYMTVSINTAMSISSAVSNDSPPSFAYPQERQLPADTSTLGGSRANSSSHGRSWADTIRESNSSFSSPEPRKSSDHLGTKTLHQDLATSRAEVAQLKARIAHMEALKEQEQQDIEEKVRNVLLNVVVVNTAAVLN
jgi:hypothetical protein